MGSAVANPSYETSPAPSTSPASSTSPAPPSPNPSVTYTKDQLDQLWQQVTALVKPPIAQTLFQQQGRLITFDGTVAKVAIKSKQLMRLAEQRVEKLTVAFEQVLSHSVRVTMEVGALTAAPAQPAPPVSPSVQPASYAPPSPEPYSSPTPAAPTPPVAPPSPQVPSSPPAMPPAPPINGRPEVNASYSAAPPAPAQPIAPVASPPSAVPPAPPTLPPIQNEDAETQSVKRFATMFNGEIVDLDDSDLELLPPIRNSESATQDSNGANSSTPTPPPQNAGNIAPPHESTSPPRPYDPDVPF